MAARPRARIREVIRSTDPAVASGHELLRRTFPTMELVDRSEWRHSLREREAGLWTDIQWHLVVAEVGRRVVGVATGNYLGNVNTGVIGYLAVVPDARGLRIGPRLRARLLSLFRRDAIRTRREPLGAVIGEVRADNPWLRTLVRRGRVLPLDFGYLQPRLRRGGRAVSLVLYYESFDRSRRRLSARLLRKLLYTLWRRIYRISRPLSHPAFRKMIAELDRRPIIGPISFPRLHGGHPNA